MQKPPFLKTIWFLLVWDRKKKCVSYFPAIASHSGAEKLTATISQGRQIKIFLRGVKLKSNSHFIVETPDAQPLLNMEWI